MREAASSLTKSFTEGDAAVACLKSVQLGDTLCSRLITAIEARSGSQGGLDAIFADAVTGWGGASQSALRGAGGMAEEKVQMMLSQLQNGATGAAKNAHETLIATLSHRSRFWDIDALRIEETFVALEGQFEGDMSADEIAALARGEGGTIWYLSMVCRWEQGVTSMTKNPDMI